MFIIQLTVDIICFIFILFFGIMEFFYELVLQFFEFVFAMFTRIFGGSAVELRKPSYAQKH